MSNKPIKLPDIGFNEALQRIAKFSKDDLHVEKKNEQKTDDKTRIDLQKPTKKQ
jgi:hypothetical protein